MSEARALWEAGKRDEALAMARAALQADRRMQRETVEAFQILMTAAGGEADPRIEEAFRLMIALGEKLRVPEKSWEIRRDLALHLGRIGRYDDAVTAARDALALAEKSRPNPRISSSFHLLGHLARDAGRLDEAEAAYERALDGAGENETIVLGGLLDLYLRQKRWPEAERARKRLFELHRPTGLNRAISLQQIADVVERQGRTREAVEWAKKAFAILARLPNLGGGDAGLLLRDISLLLEQAGERAEALKVAKHALELARRTRGATHPDVKALEARVRALAAVP